MGYAYIYWIIFIIIRSTAYYSWWCKMKMDEYIKDKEGLRGDGLYNNS